MLLPLDGRNIYYDLIGSEQSPVVCLTHSLASDGGMWAEQVPALVVCGAEDPGAPPDENKQIAALLPNALYEEIADARHLPNIESPDIFNRLLTGWLKSCR